MTNRTSALIPERRGLAYEITFVLVLKVLLLALLWFLFFRSGPEPTPSGRSPIAGFFEPVTGSTR